MRLACRVTTALVSILIVVLPVSAFAQASTYKIEELKPGIGEVEPRSDGYVHRTSGYLFPRALSELPARKSSTYGPGNADVYYTLYGGGNGDGWINLYVYPASIILSEEIANVSASIVESIDGRRGAPLVEMGTVPAGVKEGWFEGSIQGARLLTGYRIARVGDWFIKARISIPENANEATIKRLGAALNAIDFAPAYLTNSTSAKAKEPTA